MYRVSPHLDRLALSLLAGAALASLAVTFAPAPYYDLIETRLLPDHALLPLLTPQVLVTQGLMALFLFVLGKEFYESLRFEGGLMAAPGARRLITAMIAGALGLPLIAWGLSGQLDLFDSPGLPGWSLTLGADLALAWALGRSLFGKDHPALPLLLFLAVTLDMIAATGLALERLAAALTALLPAPELADQANRLEGATKLLWLVPAVLAPLAYRALQARGTSQRQQRRLAALGPILLTALITWGAVLMSGLPAALALLPLIPLIPHAPRSLGLFAEAEALLHDPLNRLEALILPALPLIAFLFGLVAGGIDLGALATLGADTARVLGTLTLRPLGMLLGALAALAFLGARLPPAMRLRDLLLVALLLAPGLTLPLLALDQGLGGGGAQSGTRAGLVLSVLFGLLALALGRIWTRAR